MSLHPGSWSYCQQRPVVARLLLTDAAQGAAQGQGLRAMSWSARSQARHVQRGRTHRNANAGSDKTGKRGQVSHCMYTHQGRQDSMYTGNKRLSMQQARKWAR